MRIFRWARAQRRWLRACLVGLALVLALDSLGHVRHTHGHDFDGRPGVEIALCGFCGTFESLAAGPSLPVFVPDAARHATHSPFLKTAPLSLRPTLRLVPRGPPA